MVLMLIPPKNACPIYIRNYCATNHFVKIQTYLIYKKYKTLDFTEKFLVFRNNNKKNRNFNVFYVTLKYLIFFNLF